MNTMNEKTKAIAKAKKNSHWRSGDFVYQMENGKFGFCSDDSPVAKNLREHGMVYCKDNGDPINVKALMFEMIK